MAHEGDSKMEEKMITVRFEPPTVWRATANEKPRMSLTEIMNKTMQYAEFFVLRDGGRVIPRDPSKDGNHIYMEIYEDTLPYLEEEGWVGKEYPDQVKSTLQVLSP